VFIVPKGVGESLAGMVKQISALAGLSPEAVKATPLAEMAAKAGKTLENLLNFPEGKAIVSNARSALTDNIA
jgi:hypothetical protein